MSEGDFVANDVEIEDDAEDRNDGVEDLVGFEYPMVKIHLIPLVFFMVVVLLFGLVIGREIGRISYTRPSILDLPKNQFPSPPKQPPKRLLGDRPTHYDI